MENSSISFQNVSETLVNSSSPANISERINESAVGMSHHGLGSPHMSSFYASIFLIWIPGFFTNLIALYFIIRDIKKAIFPAIVLLLVLCSSDFTAVCFSFLHTMVKYNIKDWSNATCVSLMVLHAFFKLYSGVLNVLMATDRVLAICMPFYYKKHITVVTWIIVCLIAAIATGLLNILPLFGLGSYWGFRSTGEMYCSSISYKPKSIERVYGLSFGFAGMIIALTIVIMNVILIRTILKLVSRVIPFVPSDTTTSMTESENNSAKANQTSFEIAFAKLMLGLAAVYLVCDTPYNVTTLMMQFNININRTLIGFIHLLAGFSYTIDPVVYILIRKTNRKKIIDLCCCRKE